MTDPTSGPAADATASAQHTNERLYKLLVQGIREYRIYVFDIDGRVQTWNPGAQQTKGYLEHEIIGQPYEVFFTPEDYAAGKPARILEHAKQHGVCRDEGWRVRKDGSRFFATHGDGEQVFTVKDNGVGIDLALQSRLLKIFHRLRRADEDPGSGIGLATCKKIVEQRGGRIWADSQPGMGAAFSFTIPDAV